MDVARVFISEISRVRVERYTVPYLSKSIEEDFKASVEKITAVMTIFSDNCPFMGTFQDYLCPRPDRNAADLQLAAIRRIHAR